MGKITYEFVIETGEVFSFDIDTNKPANTGMTPVANSAAWTSLEYHKCENCPFKSEDHPHCPVALDIESVAQKFSALLSWKRAEVWVRTEERSYHKTCDLQTGLRSMLGLMMALSMCPILSQLKPLASSHLPFATFQETVSRVVGNYLIRQFLNKQQGSQPDWSLNELKGIYKELVTVNFSMLERIRAACEEDANMNAISIFFSMASIVNMALEEQLDEMEEQFIASKKNALKLPTASVA
ncbi:MAG: hypothetical protein KJT03_09565 [Verrucomicrobiae bacterium]|nr:hypothetical protein [Verrucomicrobiae bacterium]